MYYIEIIHKDETIATDYQDLLSDSVDFANKVSYQDCHVKIYECIKSLCDVEKIIEVMSWKDDGFKV
tara:strand:+ start:2256 stop:2456 length:201 start_codon:yes stop_codon:yes gene_type:complete